MPKRKSAAVHDRIDRLPPEPPPSWPGDLQQAFNVVVAGLDSIHTRLDALEIKPAAPARPEPPLKPVPEEWGFYIRRGRSFDFVTTTDLVNLRFATEDTTLEQEKLFKGEFFRWAVSSGLKKINGTGGQPSRYTGVNVCRIAPTSTKGDKQ